MVGERSYGLYLWHYPLLWVVLPWLLAPRVITAPILLAMSWGLTCLSWRFVEQPFRPNGARVREASRSNVEPPLQPNSALTDASEAR
jgi:peptidoglycan/LPS O-acetylase OafA/YrhL